MSGYIIRARYALHPSYPGDLLKIARQSLELARDQAHSLIKDARARAADKIRGARLRAQRTGKVAGRRAAQGEHLNRLLELEEWRGRILCQLQDECLELCLTVVREVISEEILTNRASLATRIASALASLTKSYQIKVKVNPEDLVAVQHRLGEEVSRSLLVIETDQELAAGNAKLETSAGVLELDWQAHLTAVVEALRRVK